MWFVVTSGVLVRGLHQPLNRRAGRSSSSRHTLNKANEVHSAVLQSSHVVALQGGKVLLNARLYVGMKVELGKDVVNMILQTTVSLRPNPLSFPNES